MKRQEPVKPEMLDPRVEAFWLSSQIFQGMRRLSTLVLLLMVCLIVDAWVSRSQLSWDLLAAMLICYSAVCCWADEAIVNRTESVARVNIVHIWPGTSVGVIEYYDGTAYLFSDFDPSDYQHFWKAIRMSGALHAKIERHKVVLPEDHAEAA